MSVIAILLSAVLGGSGAALQLPPFQRAQELLTGIFQDVEAIYASFAGGPNDPKSPVVDQRALEQDRGHLNDASNKAAQLANELAKLSDAANGGNAGNGGNGGNGGSGKGRDGR